MTTTATDAARRSAVRNVRNKLRGLDAAMPRWERELRLAIGEDEIADRRRMLADGREVRAALAAQLAGLTTGSAQ
jgi:hypothetical protein